jgi:hypothetical protein
MTPLLGLVPVPSACAQPPTTGKASMLISMMAWVVAKGKVTSK